MTRNDSGARSGLAVLVITLALMGTLYVVRYYYFVHHLSQFEVISLASYERPSFPHLSEREGLHLGWAHTDADHPQSSYANAQRQKEAGTVRIGIFGDSFVEGIEAEYGFDFPSLLQRRLHESGFERVEVLNFGVRSYGVHQSYMLWSYLGRQYGLDYVVIMPFQWHEERDSSFLYHYNSLGPVHARYILEQDKLRLVSVIGETHEEANRAYHTLVPPLQYIRYDDKAPMFLRVLMPMQRKITLNPFYYRLFHKTQEILETYSVLLKKLGEEAKSVIVICSDKAICELNNSVRAENLYFMESQVWDIVNRAPGLYYAPLGHLSALGNQLRAHELYSLLVGKRSARCDVIEMSFSEQQPQSRVPNTLPLYEYNDISVNISNRPVASFVVHGQDAPPHKFSESLDIQGQKIAALLWTKANREIKFIPVTFRLSGKEEVFLSLRLDDESVMIPIGTIDNSDGVIGRLAITGNDDTQGSAVTSTGRKVSWNGDFLDQITVRASGQVEDVAILVGDGSRVALRGSVAESIPKRIARKVLRGEQRILFSPAAGEFAYLRGKAGQSLDVDKIGKSGTLDLALTRRSGEVDRARILSYYKTTARCSPSDRVYPNHLTIPPGRLKANTAA